MEQERDIQPTHQQIETAYAITSFTIGTCSSSEARRNEIFSTTLGIVQTVERIYGNPFDVSVNYAALGSVSPLIKLKGTLFRGPLRLLNTPEAMYSAKYEQLDTLAISMKGDPAKFGKPEVFHLLEQHVPSLVMQGTYKPNLMFPIQEPISYGLDLELLLACRSQDLECAAKILVQFGVTEAWQMQEYIEYYQSVNIDDLTLQRLMHVVDSTRMTHVKIAFATMNMARRKWVITEYRLPRL